MRDRTNAGNTDLGNEPSLQPPKMSRLVDLEYTDPWPVDGLVAVSRCPVCGSHQRDLLHDGLRDSVFFVAPGTWTMYRCLVCGSGYLDPRPSEDTLWLAYRTYFTHTEASPRPLESELNPLRLLARSLANGYRNHRFGSDLRPATRLGLAVFAALPNYRERLDRSGRHLPSAKPHGRLLDLGCGNGAFLQKAHSWGWEVVGIDPDPAAVAKARRRVPDVFEGSVEVLEDETESFDVVTISHVIEHVPFPVDLLKATYRLLRPGGQVWIDTPNLDAYNYERFGAFWQALDPPRHLVILTWASLTRALVECGFVDTRGRTALFANATVASRAIELGRDPYHERPSRWSVTHRELRRLQAVLQDRSRSEFITVTARKPDR